MATSGSLKAYQRTSQFVYRLVCLFVCRRPAQRSLLDLSGKMQQDVRAVDVFVVDFDPQTCSNQRVVAGYRLGDTRV